MRTSAGSFMRSPSAPLVSAAAWLLALLCLGQAGWARGSPLPGAGRRLPACLLASAALVAAANESLAQLQGLGTLGFECTLEEVDLEDITKNQINTIKACIPEASENGNCQVLEKADFDETKCLKGISEDLKLYKGEFRSFSNQKILDAIDQMMQALNINSASVPQPASNTGLPSFNDRLRLCSVLQAFLIRAMTINRMMNYLNSPENSS